MNESQLKVPVKIERHTVCVCVFWRNCKRVVRSIHGLGTNANMQRWQFPSQSPDEKRQVVSEHRRSTFHHLKARRERIIHREKKKSGNHNYSCSPSHFVRSSGGGGHGSTLCLTAETAKRSRYGSVSQKQLADRDVPGRNGSLRAMSPLPSQKEGFLSSPPQANTSTSRPPLSREVRFSAARFLRRSPGYWRCHLNKHEGFTNSTDRKLNEGVSYHILLELWQHNMWYVGKLPL